MKKVCYFTNIEVPYRADFFALLSEEVDLTVLYQDGVVTDRDKTWSKSGSNAYKRVFLNPEGKSSIFSRLRRMMKILLEPWDCIIIGCYNEPIQIVAVQVLRLLHKPFIINLDGEAFIEKGYKGLMKKTALRGAWGYLTAGKHSRDTLKHALKTSVPVGTYYFSSLSSEQLRTAASKDNPRKDYILVVGRYYPYKGMDIALEVARNCSDHKFIFVGMGDRTELFKEENGPIPPNVELIPFLQPDELRKYYRECRALLLPSRRECWGLVINEAAAYGTPIVSTTGSGAALEFLYDKYKQYLAPAENVEALSEAMRRCLNDDTDDYSKYLKDVSKGYSIERSVQEHVAFISRLYP